MEELEDEESIEGLEESKDDGFGGRPDRLIETALHKLHKIDKAFNYKKPTRITDATKIRNI